MVVARFPRVAVTLALSALGASFAGCTSSGGKPSQIANSVKLRRQVQITSCVSTAGGWKAAGSAVNPAKKRLHLTITVFFTTTAATVLDYARTKVTVPPGATRTWTAAARFRPEPTMRCVLRGVG